jgi:adenylate cyclase
LEYPIPVLEAEALMGLRRGSLIEKTRHVVPCGDLSWEIDVFSGENAGLTIAEIELRHEHERIELPDWIGAEVTGQLPYYNSSLAERPFSSWPAGTRQSQSNGGHKSRDHRNGALRLNRPGSRPSTARP